jgi:hypothetical protein
MNEPSQKSRLCEICGSEIPKKPVLTLEELGYTRCEIRSPFRKMLYFCPNHLPKEIATCIGDVVAWKPTIAQNETTPQKGG